jgi:hypothetical protein
MNITSPNKKKTHNKSRLSTLTKEQRRRLKASVTILTVLDESIDDTTKAANIAFENAHNQGTAENWQIMNCVYAFLIIRTSSFYDELNGQFLKIRGLTKSRELVGAISHFRKLYTMYRVREFRNYLAHNRKTVSRKKKGKKYRPISNADIAKISGINSHSIFSSFGTATSRIVNFINQL